MGKLAYDAAYQPGPTGMTVVAGATAASTPIPNASDGNRARVVRLMVTGNLYVKFSKGGTAATVNDMLLSPNFDVLIDCKQFDTISYIQETASAKLNITPLET